jgi:tetratricopeptide (TPR) repeat protein
MMTRTAAWAVGLVLVISAAGWAQAPSDEVSAGIRESIARKPAQALQYFERAIQADPRNYVALYRAASELVDLGEFERNTESRTAMYARATDYAKRATVVNPNDAEGYFHLSRAIGRTALAVGPRERVKYGIAVRDNALKALEFAPRHPGALHVMGVWNAEILRLNGIARLVAKTFLGGKVFDTASWEEATRYMERSVAAEPNRLVHRLDLARVYRDTGRKADARAAYRAAIACADQDANDDKYRADADKELKALGAG